MNCAICQCNLSCRIVYVCTVDASNERLHEVATSDLRVFFLFFFCSLSDEGSGAGEADVVPSPEAGESAGTSYPALVVSCSGGGLPGMNTPANTSATWRFRLPSDVGAGSAGSAGFCLPLPLLRDFAGSGSSEELSLSMTCKSASSSSSLPSSASVFVYSARAFIFSVTLTGTRAED
jgi:hypothetical protein